MGMYEGLALDRCYFLYTSMICLAACLHESIPNMYADDTNITAYHTLNINKVEDVLNKDLDI
jgi:hypothetical protein